MSGNTNLHKAKKEKNDEFFTLYEDIEKEMVHYKQHFNGKTVYCNCDDYRRSNFWKYFYNNFNELRIRRLTATNYDIGEGGYKAEYDGENMTVVPLQGNGDFRSEECVEFLKEADIVVTNPPFSLFREYIAQLMEYGKKFLVIGSQNAITYKEVFPLIKNNELWLGTKYVKEFIQPNGEIKKFGNICWFTNLDHAKRNKPLDLYRHYSSEYKHYDNYDAIEVGKVCEIPMDYDGVMGVPITFLDKYCPEQFEIVSIASRHSWANYTEILKSINFNPNVNSGGGLGAAVLNGKATYARILIRHRK